ncbi:jg6529 [Pararge aegeria aegeria]|uniref:Jg6529 protein n=1 Tax=Pararge aegeria aegeria TaxID=348720 RepID=A0A8S4S5F1_9NEOP|nr:jg6529 [Pararge aegeria aegeria]
MTTILPNSLNDMRARLAARERDSEQEARARDKELHQLRAEVTRLTKILFSKLLLILIIVLSFKASLKSVK